MNQDMIARQSFKAAGRTFEPGDLYDIRDNDKMPMHAKRDHLERAGFITPLTRDAYRLGMQQRPINLIGKGFTPDYLIARGILDGPSEPEADAPEAIKGEAFAVREGDVVERGYILRPRQAGPRKFWSVYHPSGRLIEERELPSLTKAQALIEPLEDAVLDEARLSTDSAAEDTSAEP